MAPPRPPAQHLRTVADLRDHFAALDAELASVFGEFSSDDWGAVIHRPDGTRRTRREQFDIYAQAMLIFLGKMSVYARAKGQPIPLSVARFIG